MMGHIGIAAISLRKIADLLHGGIGWMSCMEELFVEATTHINLAEGGGVDLLNPSYSEVAVYVRRYQTARSVAVANHGFSVTL